MKRLLRYIQWSYVAPRLSVAVVCMLLVWFCLNPLLRWSLISAGQSATNAKVDVASLNMSLLRGRAHLRGVAVTDPNDVDRNLLQFDEAGLVVDGVELLKRRYVIKDGYVSGLQFNTPRTSSGRLETARAVEPPKPKAHTRLDWFKKATAILGDQHLEEQLETVRVGKELADRWPREYQQLADRAEQLKQRLNAMRQFVENPNVNPLTAGPLLQRALEDLTKTRNEILNLRTQIGRLRQQLPVDRDRLLAAKENDLRLLETLTDLENLNPSTLAEYFLGEEAATRVSQVIAWIEWGRQYIPSQREPVKAHRSGGSFVDFPGTRQRPNFLIERLALDGEAIVGDRLFHFGGTARDLTHQPRKHGRPTTLDIETSGSLNVQISAVFDRTTATPRDKFEIHCPGIQQPARMLGDPDKLALAMSPGALHFDLLLSLEGRQLDGEIHVAQRGTLTPRVADAYGGAVLAPRLAEAVQSVRQLDIVVKLGGELSHPKWQLQSDFGADVARGFNAVVHRDVQALRQKVAARVEASADQQLARVQQWIEQGESYVLEHLAAGESQIAQLKSKVADRLGISLGDNRLGIPVDNLPERIGIRPRLNEFLPFSNQ